MGKYLKKFSTDSARVEYEDSENYLEPYVSYVEGDNTVHYNKVETKLVVYYDIQNTSSPTTIWTNYDRGVVKSIEVDRELLDSALTTTYQFDSVGEHVIKYEFNDPTTVGNNAPIFYNLTTVKRIVIPNTFTAIGQNAFYNCSGLTNVTIGNGVTSIGEHAFQGCSSLTSLTIPNSVTSIGNSAFEGTQALKILNYDAQCELNSLFRSIWSNLETVIIGDSTPSIGSQAFQGCGSLTSVTIGSGVTSIGNAGFQGCGSLTSVTIPNSVTSIGNSAFGNCSSLTSITSLATTAPTIQFNTFIDVNSGGTLYVPIGSSGYNTWMQNADYYLGLYNWTKVEQ